jgi:hypothetical protein
MKDFFLNLISSSSDSSSKRFGGLWCIGLLSIILLWTLFTTKVFPEYMFWGLVSLICSLFSLAVVEKLKKAPATESDNPQNVSGQ